MSNRMKQAVCAAAPGLLAVWPRIPYVSLGFLTCKMGVWSLSRNATVLS